MPTGAPQVGRGRCKQYAQEPAANPLTRARSQNGGLRGGLGVSDRNVQK